MTQKRTGRPQAVADARQALNYTPRSGQWAAGWDQGSEWGRNHPNDQDWIDGYWSGYNSAMDIRFPGWRTPVDNEEDED